MNLSRILMIGCESAEARTYRGYLSEDAFALNHAQNAHDALEQLDDSSPHAVLLDFDLPDMDGMDVLRRLHNRPNKLPVIVLAANGSVNNAVEAMRAGATDFLVKPFGGERLRVTLTNAVERYRLENMVAFFRRESDELKFGVFVGRSSPMQRVYRAVERAASSAASVFVTGESGTGKELVAQSVHRLGPRRHQPFVEVNCAAIPRELIESELFGHVRGAFTGATANREGAAGRADGGTLFLDEIGEMDVDLQSKLLRFLQSGTFVPVGSNSLRTVDVRIVCATNQDPLARVRQGLFREDLYYRLHVLPIEMPPLRERGDDVIDLAQHVLQEVAREEGREFRRLGPDVQTAFAAYSWPGNVRELQNVIRNAVVLNDGEILSLTMLSEAFRRAALRTGALSDPVGFAEPSHGAPAQPFAQPANGIADPRETARTAAPSPALPPDSETIRPLRDVVNDAIDAAITACNGNIPRAAALLEVSPSTIYRRLKSKSDKATRVSVP